MNRRNVLKMLFAAGAVMLVPFAKSAKAATTHQVEIKGFKFAPKSLSVKVDDTIVFTNKDGAPHTATARDKKWNTKTLTRNKTASIAVTADMDSNYFCKFHPAMSGKLIIS
jgi:plastocyanin